MRTFRTVVELREAYRNGVVKPADVVRACVRETNRLDPGPDGLHSFIRVADQSLCRPSVPEAQNTPAKDDGLNRPLEGIPVAIKDNIDTVDLGCTAGSVLLKDVPVTSDAPLVTALKNAGALIVGKANLSEWANFRSTRSSSGWSSAGGQTLNPEHPTRTPCGSSSGSASAVAAGLVPVAIGTETDGSIICPASTQGLVGFKPTVGRISQEGIVPISWSQDTAGPIATTVTDAWIVYNVMAHGAQGKTSESPEAADLSGARIGVYPPGNAIHPEAAALFERAKQALAEAGAVLHQLEPAPDQDEIGRAEWTVLKYEFPIAIRKYLEERRPASPWKTLADLRAANRERAETILAVFDQDIWDACLDDPDLTDQAYREARAVIEEKARRSAYDVWFKEQALSVVIAPANGPAWVIDHLNGDHYTGSGTPPAAPTGNPILTVPMGHVRGLPIGLGFYGPANSDAELFRFGLAWEQLQRE